MEEVHTGLVKWESKADIDLPAETTSGRKKSWANKVTPAEAQVSQEIQNTQNAWSFFCCLSCCSCDSDSDEDDEEEYENTMDKIRSSTASNEAILFTKGSVGADIKPATKTDVTAASNSPPALTHHKSNSSAESKYSDDDIFVKTLQGFKLPCDAMLYIHDDPKQTTETIKALLEGLNLAHDPKTCFQIFLVLSNIYNESEILNDSPREIAFSIVDKPSELIVFIEPSSSFSPEKGIALPELEFNTKRLLQGTEIEHQLNQFSDNEFTTDVKDLVFQTVYLKLNRIFELKK